MVTLDNYYRSFQYKILNNVLHLNKKLFTFRKLTSPLCPFCKFSDETVLHLFHECNIILNLWNELVLFFKTEFTLFDLTLQAAFLGFLNVDSEPLLIQNHLFLRFKICIYNSRRSESLKIKSLIREITKFKDLEEKISLNNEKKTCCIQEKIATSWECFEEQNFLTFYLIQLLALTYVDFLGVRFEVGSRGKITPLV